jgi:biopolymer transport protein ExbB/TolQ
MRHLRGGSKAYPQSYPQIVWMGDWAIIQLNKILWSVGLFTIIQAAGWPIWPLLICSVVALALVIERMMSLRPLLVAPEGLVEQALKASHDNLPSEEAMQQLHDNSVLGRVLASGLHAMKDEPLILSLIHI